MLRLRLTMNGQTSHATLHFSESLRACGDCGFSAATGNKVGRLSQAMLLTAGRLSQLRHRLRAVRYIQFVEDAPQMTLDSTRAEVKDNANFNVGFA